MKTCSGRGLQFSLLVLHLPDRLIVCTKQGLSPFVVFSLAQGNTRQHNRGSSILWRKISKGNHRALLHEAVVHVLTFSDGEWRVGEVESHQLSRELAKEAAGDSTVEERTLIAHSIHQCDGLGGIGRAHDLNDTGAKGKEIGQIR